MKLSKKEIEKSERKWRLNLINSVSGIKPANLIGTKSEDGIDNLAIFSSVVHLGSNPAQFGFVVRPISDVPRDTYVNIEQTKYYTINSISKNYIKKAHYTSAKFDKNVSEFEKIKIKKVIIDNFYAPFVKDSSIKIGLKHIESINLPNKCKFIIGSVELLIFPDNSINKIGQIDLSSFSNVGISGLNTYYGLNILETFPYVRINEIPIFE